MGTAPKRLGELRKVGQNLFRYSANRVYYAVFKVAGKKIWKSLETADRDLAQRRLKEEVGKRGMIEPRHAGMNLAELLSLYEASLVGFASRTQATRKSILRIFKDTWQHGLALPVRSVTSGQLQLWLGEQRSRLKNSSFNEHLRFLRQVFALAVGHKVIVESPAAQFKQLRLEKPIRVTPSWEQFQALVHNIREQNPRRRAGLPHSRSEEGVGERLQAPPSASPLAEVASTLLCHARGREGGGFQNARELAGPPRRRSAHRTHVQPPSTRAQRRHGSEARLIADRLLGCAFLPWTIHLAAVGLNILPQGGAEC